MAERKEYSSVGARRVCIAVCKFHVLFFQRGVLPGRRVRGDALRLFFSLTEDLQLREKHRGLYPVEMNES